MKVLVVDDEALVRRSLGRALKARFGVNGIQKFSSESDMTLSATD